MMKPRIAARARVQSALEEKILAIRALESEKEDSQRTIDKLNKRIARLESDIRGLTLENTKLRTENITQQQRIEELLRVAEAISARRESETRLHLDNLKYPQK